MYDTSSAGQQAADQPKHPQKSYTQIDVSAAE